MSRLLLVVAFFQLAAAEPYEFDHDKHICAVCNEIAVAGSSCERFGACHAVNASNLKERCDERCLQPLSAMFVPSATAKPDIRVTKGFGTKAYNQVRISVITPQADKVPIEGFFDYSSRFKWRWDQNGIHTAMKEATPGQDTVFNIGTELKVRLPAQGDGVAGVLIADPCMGRSGTIISMIGCAYAAKYKLNARLPELLNTFVPDDDTDFWGILGDNFYDKVGDVSADVYSRIDYEVKQKIFFTVAGNHDFWIFGDPKLTSYKDQCGNGFMQYYAQDAKSAEFNAPGNTTIPFDVSVVPGSGIPLQSCVLAHWSNFFWYNQVGNIGFVGQSGGHSYTETQPFMREACAWLGKQPGLKVAVLFGHWDIEGLGAPNTMAMPKWYTEMAALPGCAEFEAKGMLKFVMGHTHCNDPHPYGKVNAGFRVAGFGMTGGCGNFGVPIVDTTQSRVRFWYFETETDDKYNKVIACVKSNGWRKCTDLATLWLDEPIAESEQALQIV